MTTGFSIFLTVAEELNISKSAEKHFVTQQCVSDHIKRLEEEYQVKLFNRKPKFSLTPAGKIIYETIKKIEILEKNMEGKLEDLKNEVKGEIIIGISPIRARILIPQLLKKYKKLFPNVVLSFVLDDTKNLEQYLLKGKVDLFLGVNSINHYSFKTEFLGKDTIHFICTDKIINKFIPEIDIKNMNNSIDITTIEKIPIISNSKESNISLKMKEFCKYKNVTLNEEIYISDTDTIFPMCEYGLGGSFCPTMVLESVLKYNLNPSVKDKLNIYKIKDFNDFLNLDLVYHNNIDFPLYINEFIKFLKEEIKNIYSMKKAESF